MSSKRNESIFSQFFPNADKPNVKRNNIFLLFALILAGGLLFFVLRDLDWNIFINTNKNIEYPYLIIVFVWGSATYYVRAMRLRFLLSNEQPFQVSSVFWANMVGYLGNNILPARAGELIRATYLARKYQISISFVFAVGVVERIIDLVTLIILGSLAFSYTEAVSTFFQNATKIVSLIGLAGLIIVFVLPYLNQFILPILEFVFRSNTNYIKKVENLINRFFDGLKSLHSIKRFVKFTGATAIIWMMDALGLVTLSYILNMPITLYQSLVLLAALGLSSAIPSTPGYVGVYQFVAVTVLAPFGISRESALAYIIVSQLINYLIVGFWGLISLWQFNKKGKL